MYRLLIGCRYHRLVYTLVTADRDSWDGGGRGEEFGAEHWKEEESFERLEQEQEKRSKSGT